MTSLKEKYENYLSKKQEYEREKYHIDETEKKLRQEVINAVSNINVEALTNLGYQFECDTDKLTDKDYLIAKLTELKYISDQLEQRGHAILVNY